MAQSSEEKISDLPLRGAERAEFLRAATQMYQDLVDRLRLEHRHIVDELWDAGTFIDEHLLHRDMLPLERAHARALILPALVDHCLALRDRAGRIARHDARADV